MAPAPSEPRPVRVFANSFSRRCTDCGEPITFYKLVEPRSTEKPWMPFNREPVPLRITGGGPNAPLVYELDLNDNHWKDCTRSASSSAPARPAATRPRDLFDTYD